MNNKASKNGPGEYLKLVRGWITGAIGFVTVIVSFVILLQREATLVLSVSLMVGVGLLLGNLLYVRFAQRKDIDKLIAPGPEDKLLYLKPARHRALVGIYIVVTLLFVGGGLFIWDQTRPPSSNTVIILVANFDGPDQTYGVTETIFSRLHAATQEYDDVQVEALNDTITALQGSSVARARGEERGASIVLWGWYRVPRDSALITVHFEVLKSPRYLSLRQEERSQTLAVAELESFQIQTRLSNEMRYLTLLTLGLARFEVEDYDGAIDRFTGALDQPDVPEDMVDPAGIYFFRGTAYYYKGEYDRAIADYDRALALNPEYADAYNNRGNAYGLKGDYDRAIADYDRALALNPDYADAYNNRGVAYGFKGDYDRAIADYDRTLALNPEDAYAYNNRGAIYDLKGDYDRAISDYDRALALNPEFAEVYYNRGNTYADKGDYDRAISDYDRALALNPEDTSAYNNRGATYNLKGDYDRAISDYDRALDLNPEDAEVYHNRGGAYYYKGEYDRAISDFDRAIELNPEMANAYLHRGYSYFKKSEYDRAIANYDRAIELDSADFLAYRNRGYSYRLKGDSVRAEIDLARAKEIQAALQGRLQPEQ